MYGYVGQGRVMYAYEGICIAMHGYVHVRQCRAVYGYVWLCVAMYKVQLYGCVGWFKRGFVRFIYLLRINVFCSLVLCIMCR